MAEKSFRYMIESTCENIGGEYNRRPNACDLKVNHFKHAMMGDTLSYYSPLKFVETATKDDLVDSETKNTSIIGEIENAGCSGITTGIIVLSHGLVTKEAPMVFGLCKVFTNKIERVLRRKQ